VTIPTSHVLPAPSMSEATAIVPSANAEAATPKDVSSEAASDMVQTPLGFGLFRAP
jgi:hypothetical protein